MTGRKKLRELKKAGIVYYEISDEQGKILEFQLIKFRIAKSLYGLSKTITQHNIPCAWDSDVLSKFERISDQSDKLFYTITVLNDFDKSVKIDIPYSLSEDMVSQNLRETLVEFDTIRLKNCNFRCEVHFPEITRNTEFRSTVFFSNVFISGRDKEFNVNSKSNRKSLNFYNCRFSEYLKVKDYIGFDLGIFKNSLIESLSLADTSFLGNLRIKECKIVESDFYNTSFYELADFYSTEFKYPTKFHQTDFLKVAIFSKSIFSQEVQFIYNKVDRDTYISFENAVFKKAIDISRANFYCTFNFWSAKGLTSLNNSEILSLKTSKMYLYDGIHEDEEKEENNVLSNFRESLRTIKNNFRSRNDKISSLDYQKEEMNIYSIELNETKGVFWDRVILFFNKWSNNHGTSFSRGVVFTIAIGVLWYCLLIFVSDAVNNFDTFSQLSKLKVQSQSFEIIKFPFFEYNKLLDNDIIKSCLDYLLITKLSIGDYPIAGSNPLIYAMFYLGKFFIGFGYYQTIAAFRKFLKN